jgi:hypothetical protein
VATLAAKLGVDRRSVQRSLKRLVDAGLLDNLGKIKGRKSNSYVQSGSGVTGDISAARATRRLGSGSGVTGGGGSGVTQIRRNRTREGTRESPRLRRDALSEPLGFDTCLTQAKQAFSRKTSPRPRQGNALSGKKNASAGNSSTKNQALEFPGDWSFGNDELAAAKQIAGWDLVRVEQEFESFRDWHQQRAKHSHDWPAAWRSWCRRGVEFEATKSSRPLTGLASAIAGLKGEFSNE